MLDQSFPPGLARALWAAGVGLAVVALAVLAVSYGAKGTPATPAVGAIPPIDVSPPAVTETATFAHG